MTRRRFFPSRPAQSLPGQTVQLEVQLRSNATVDAPAAMPPVSVQWGCTGWLCDPLLIAEPEGLAVAALADGRISISGIEFAGVLEYSALINSVWQGVPAALDPFGRARPWPGQDFLCDEIEIDTTAYHSWPGGLFSATLTGDAIWVAAWDSPFIEDPEYSYPSYHRAHILGSVLRISTNPTGGSETLTETLIAKAVSSSTGKVLHELVFRARRFAY